MLRRLFGPKLPDLVTVLTIRQEDGYEVSFVADPGVDVPKAPRPMATLTETRTVVDALLADHYMRSERFATPLLERQVGVGYAIYPWKESKVPKDLARTFGFDFLVIVVDEITEGFVAHAEDVKVTARDLDELVTTLEQRVRRRWPEITEPGVPGMLNWQRKLTSSGFVSPPPWRPHAAT